MKLKEILNMVYPSQHIKIYDDRNVFFSGYKWDSMDDIYLNLEVAYIYSESAESISIQTQ